MAGTGFGVNQRFQPQGVCNINAKFDGNLIRARAGMAKYSDYKSGVHDNAIEEFVPVFREFIDVDKCKSSIQQGGGTFEPCVFTDWAHRSGEEAAPVFVGVAAAFAESGVGRKLAAVAIQTAGMVNLHNYGPDTFLVGDLVYWGDPDVTGGEGAVRNKITLPRRPRDVIRCRLARAPPQGGDPSAYLIGKCYSMSGPGDPVHVLLH